MKAHLVLASLALFVASHAQSPPCAALNDANTTTSGSITSYGFAGPNGNAWQFTPAATIPALAMRIYTGNTMLSGDRYMTLEVWSDSAGLPGARIAGGTWKISAPLGNAWQGSDFDGVAVLNASTPYWLVWIDPGFSTVPTEPGGTTLPAASRSGASWTAAGSSALKFRLYCGFLDEFYVIVNGSPCPRASGPLGTLFTNQAPTVGNGNFALEGTGFASGVLALIVLGGNPAWASAQIPGMPLGCMQHTDAITVVFGTTGTSNVRGPTAAGHVRFPVPIPPNGALAGLFVGSQIGASDPGSAAVLPFVSTNGLQLIVY